MSITTATEKLNKEKAKASNKYLAEPIIDYLLKRVAESESFADDVDQKHKTWEKCEKYVTDKARKALNSKNGALPKEMVFEWAEDYYHLDDKAQAEKEAKEKAEHEAKAKKQAEERKAKQAASKAAPPKEETPAPAKKEEPKKQEKGAIEGQMDFSSFFGI